MTSDVISKAQQAQSIARFMGSVSSQQKNNGLQAMADALRTQQGEILKANDQDVQQGRKQGMSDALIDRLALDKKRIQQMAEGLEVLISLPDPIGEILSGSTRPNGLRIMKLRVPLGVVAMIYEARPNVTVDAAGILLKSGNAALLRGSSSALYSNKSIVKILNDALAKTGFPKHMIQLIEDTAHDSVKELVQLRQYVDLVIPRGGAGLIQSVVESATVPCIETGIGNCHVYVDQFARPDIIVPIIINSKVHRPSVCNAAESLLVHASLANEWLPRIGAALQSERVTIYGCNVTRQFLPDALPATDKEYAQEFLDYKIAIKVVNTIDDAIEHIQKYGTHHTEAIISDHQPAIELFRQNVDAAAIMINTSTRFTDGFEFGFGAEIGISTQKMHARGPMGLAELTSYKYVVVGSGQIRQ